MQVRLFSPPSSQNPEEREKKDGGTPDETPPSPPAKSLRLSCEKTARFEKKNRQTKKKAIEKEGQGAQTCQIRRRNVFAYQRRFLGKHLAPPAARGHKYQQPLWPGRGRTGPR